MTRTFSILITLLLFVTVSLCAQTGTIKGRLVDARGEGIRGAPVEDLHRRFGTTVAKDDGSFSISNVPAGPDTLRVRMLGYEDKSVPVMVYPDSETVIEIELDDAWMWAPSSEPFFRDPNAPIPPRGTMTGVVTDKRTGKPLASAHVFLTSEIASTGGGGWSSPAAGSDCDSVGRYTVQDVAGCYTAIASASGYHPEYAQVILPADSRRSLDFALFPSGHDVSLSTDLKGSVVGRIWDRKTAKPFPGVTVKLVDGAQTVSTDKEGAFTMNGITPGKHEFELSSPGYETRKRSVTIIGGVTGDGGNTVLRDKRKKTR